MSARRVLVCDDTPAKRYVLASWLRRAGFEVVEASTVAEATTLLQGPAFDIAVLDVHLPDGSGLDLTRAIRADAALTSTPVIHVSAVARETADKVTALDEGADAYLIDPIEPDELLSTVRTLLRSSGARRDAELLATRLAHLNRAAVRLNVAASVPRLVEVTARAAAEVFEGSAVAVLLDEQGEPWRGVATDRDRPVVSVPVPAERAAALLERAGAGETVTVEAGSAWGEQLPAATGSWTACPIRVDGAVEGVIAVPVVEDDEAGQRDLLLGRLAQVTAVAVENMRALAFEHRTALTLQRSLLPGVLPEPPGLRLAARYRASQRRMEVGGDFFDAFEVGGHCILVIGDVQGHSLEAAVVMAELRYSLRAYAYEGHGPAAIADLLDTLLVRSGLELIATACVLVVDPDRRHLEMVSAGHPPPILARTGGTRQLEGRGPLLGAGVGSHESSRHDLQEGDRIVLYTDGLVERRGQDLYANMDRVAAQVATSAGSPESLADELLEVWGDSEDDVALLVVDVIG